jgi:hypothetical protein
VLQDPVGTVGLLAGVEPTHRRARRAGLFDVVRAWVDGRTEVRLEREWRQTMSVALDRLPAGAEMINQDAARRVRILRIPARPSCTAVVLRGNDR